MLRFCKNCGLLLPHDADHCPQCGTPAPAAVRAAAPQPGQAAPLYEADEPEERIPETTKMTRACSMEFSRMVDAVRRTPIPPIPNCGMMDIASVSLSVGCYQAAAKYSWNLGNPPHGWEILDQFAEAIFKEVHTDAKWA